MLFQTYDRPSPVLKSNHEEPYWQPEQTVEKLYAQFEGKRFRMLQRSDVKLETEIGSGFVQPLCSCTIVCMLVSCIREFGTVSKGSWKVQLLFTSFVHLSSQCCLMVTVEF